MKGVIFTEFTDMVRSRFGLDTLDGIIGEIASATDGAYTAVGTYPDQEMYGLVAALSRRTGVSPNDLLREFGRHLFGRLASIYPLQIQHASNSFDLLESLEDVIHPNVQKLYPDAVLPRFVATRISEDALEMHYESPRGLPDLALGLIEGCAAWFDERLVIDRELAESDGSRAVFRIRRRGGDGQS